MGRTGIGENMKEDLCGDRANNSHRSQVREELTVDNMILGEPDSKAKQHSRQLRIIQWLMFIITSFYC